jgi:hypothetical protein
MGRPRKVRYINQREIKAEFGGCDTKDVLRWVRMGIFPKPVQVAGRTRIFERDAVEAFFRGRGDQAPGPGEELVSAESEGGRESF